MRQQVRADNLTICYRKKNKLVSVFHASFASWIHSYFDNVMTKFIINNRTDA